MPDVQLPKGYSLDAQPSAPPAAAQAQLPPGYTLDQPAAQSSPTSPTVAPGSSDDDIIKSFGFDPEVIKSSPRYQQMLKQQGSGVAFLLSKPGEHPLLKNPVAARLGDVGQGANDVFSGIVQLARHGAGKLGMLSDADVQYGDLLDRVQNQDYLQNVRGGQAHPALRLLGNLLMPVPELMEAKAGEGVLKTAARGAVTGAESGAMQPVLTGDPGDYAGEKGKQVGTGAAVGTAVGTAVGAVRSGVNRLAAMRQTQLPEQAASAAADRLQAGMKETPWGSLDDVEKAAAGGDRHAQQVVDQVQNAGDDPGRIMRASINLQNYRSGQTASELYDRVGQIADQNQLGAVPVEETLSALKQAETQAKIGLKDPGLNGSLKKIRDAITPKAPAAAPASGLLDASGNPIPAAQPAPVNPNTYGSVRKVISQLDEAIRAGRTGDGALLSDRATGQLQQIKNALENDSAAFVQNSKVPELQQAQDTADQFYKTQRVPFKDVTIGKAGTTDEPDQIFQKFIQAGKGDRAQKFYDALDPKGQAAVQYQLVARGINQATDPVKGFDPGKFAQYMGKLKESTGVFFQGADKRALDGLTNLMVHDAQVNQAPEKYLGQPARTIIGTAHGLTRDVPVLGRIPDTAQTAKWLLSTPRGKLYLYSARNLKPGSAGMDRISAQIAAKVATAPSEAGSLASKVLPTESEDRRDKSIAANR